MSMFVGDIKFILVLLLTGIIGSIIIMFVTGGVAGGRYMQPYFMSGTVFMILNLLNRQNISAKSAIFTSLMIALMSFPREYRFNYKYFESYIGSYSAAISRLINLEVKSPYPDNSHIYRFVQNMIPVGSKIAVRIDKPFYLDFSRNEVYVIDFPCAVSVDNIPNCSDPVSIKNYLVASGAEYFIYGIDKYSPFNFVNALRRLNGTNASPWQYKLNYLANDFDESVRYILRSENVLYMDDKFALIKL